MPDAPRSIPMQAVARPGGGVRWLAKLDPQDRARYRQLVAPLVPAVEGSLGREVLANRAVGRGRHSTVRLEPWRRARSTWTRRAEAAIAAATTRAVLIADVADCYASIAPTVVAHRLRAAGVPWSRADEVELFLHELGERGASGLPVGPPPSAILANLVLAVADEGLRASGARHLRWVDDVIVVASDPSEALRGYDAFRRALDQLGLRENHRKTSLIQDPAEVRSLLRGGGLSDSRAPACDDAAP